MEDFYYRKLDVYGKALNEVKAEYLLLNSFPEEEKYGLANQLKRAVVSVPSNIAEGMGRFSIKERLHFLDIAYGSLMETMCQLEIAHTLGYIDDTDLHTHENSFRDVSRMLIGLKRSLEEKQKLKNN